MVEVAATVGAEAGGGVGDGGSEGVGFLGFFDGFDAGGTEADGEVLPEGAAGADEAVVADHDAEAEGTGGGGDGDGVEGGALAAGVEVNDGGEAGEEAAETGAGGAEQGVGDEAEGVDGGLEGGPAFGGEGGGVFELVEAGGVETAELVGQGGVVGVAAVGIAEDEGGGAGEGAELAHEQEVEVGLGEEFEFEVGVEVAGPGEGGAFEEKGGVAFEDAEQGGHGGGVGPAEEGGERLVAEAGDEVEEGDFGCLAFALGPAISGVADMGEGLGDGETVEFGEGVGPGGEGGGDVVVGADGLAPAGLVGSAEFDHGMPAGGPGPVGKVAGDIDAEAAQDGRGERDRETRVFEPRKCRGGGRHGKSTRGRRRRVKSAGLHTDKSMMKEVGLICIINGVLVCGECGELGRGMKTDAPDRPVHTSALQTKGGEVRTVTPWEGHSFFGYYEKSPWNAAGTRLLAQRAGFMDRPPGPEDEVELGYVDLAKGGGWVSLGRTRAWNWQQGCMLQWLGESETVIYNDRENGKAVSRKVNLDTGERCTLDRPVYAVAPDGTWAVSLNFARLHHQRPGYGYAGIEDAWRAVEAPDDDGVWRVDLASGESRLLCSVGEASRIGRTAAFAGKTHRFNHAQISRDGSRFAFLHRYKTPDEEVGTTRLFTMNGDGTGLRLMPGDGLVSHYDWRDGSSLLAWTKREGEAAAFYFFELKDGSMRALDREAMWCDGHCSFSPDGRWILNDTYPDKEHHRTLYLYRFPDGPRVDLGRFLSPPMAWQIRCDLHPRWSRDGRSVCLDSIHEGVRKVYIMDVSEITLA